METKEKRSYHCQQKKCYPQRCLKLYPILAIVNLLAHNNKSKICNCGQISLQSAAVNYSFSDTFGGTIYFAGNSTLLVIAIRIV